MQESNKASYKSIMMATSMFGGVQIINIIITIIRTKAIALLLGPAGIGIAGLLSTTINLITSLTNFGLGTSAVKDIAKSYAKNDEQNIAKTTAVFRKLVWVTGSLGALITLVFSPLLSEITFGDKDFTWSFVFLSTVLLLSQLTEGKKVILQGTRQLKYLAIVKILAAVSSLFVAVPLYYFYGEDGIVPAMILMTLISYIIASNFSKKVDIKKVKVSFGEALEEGKGMLQLGLILSISGIATTLVAYLVRIYISNTGGVEQVGLYTAGFKIVGTYVGMLFTAMATDYYPRLSAIAGNTQKRNTLVNQQGEVAVFILFPIILIFIIFIPYIVQLLYSTKFLPINEMIIWAALGMVFKAGSWVISFQFLAKGSSRIYFINELVFNSYLLGFNILGYTYFGLVGLGYSFLLSYILYSIQVYILTKYYYKFTFTSSFISAFLITIISSSLCLFIALKSTDVLKYSLGSLLIISGSIYSIYQLNSKTGLLDKFKLRK